MANLCGVSHPVPAQRIAFWSCGHWGSSFKRFFNSHHSGVVVQAVCEYRKASTHERPRVDTAKSSTVRPCCCDQDAGPAECC